MHGQARKTSVSSGNITSAHRTLERNKKNKNRENPWGKWKKWKRQGKKEQNRYISLQPAERVRIYNLQLDQTEGNP